MGLGGLLLFKSHHETSGQMCETNIMYALCMLLSFSAELEENDEISLQYCLLTMNLEADVSVSFSTRYYFYCFSSYSCYLLSETAIMIYLAWESLVLLFIIVSE